MTLKVKLAESKPKLFSQKFRLSLTGSEIQSLNHKQWNLNGFTLMNSPNKFSLIKALRKQWAITL